MKPAILALDQGTTSSRAILFDQQLKVISLARREFQQIFPQPGWVEHNPEEISSSLFTCIQEIIQNTSNIKITAIGITNQRETTLIWDRKTGMPIYNALVWQDRRTQAWCQKQREAGLSDWVHKKTGLILDPYFSASKIAWLLDHIPRARTRAEQGELAFGTIDSWLLWKLTQGKVHATDITNASRTLLWNIEKQDWDQDLLDHWNIPASLLPEVHPSQYFFGETHLLGLSIPILGMAGDQQSALLGQGCIHAGQAKNTYGTGCFMLLNTGNKIAFSKHGLLTTTTTQFDSTFNYALEGSVFIGGAVVQWLRDGLQLIKKASEVETLAGSVSDSGGVVLVPAFTGIGAPYWNPNAKGSLVGLTRGTTRAHIARAALEAIAFQCTELLQAIQEDCAHPLECLRVDGGACANNLLMQFQADLLGIRIERPRFLESTALGAALLAGIGAQFWSQLNDVLNLIEIDRTFEPQISRDEAMQKLQYWKKAVQATLSFATPDSPI